MIELKLTAYGTTSLGDLIETLERVNQSATVQFDFCYLAPTDLASYRGYYDCLALGWSDTTSRRFNGEYWPSVEMLLSELRKGVGGTYEGWKGGTYYMSSDTPLFVANPGQTGGTGIVGVQDDEHTVVLVTAKVD